MKIIHKIHYRLENMTVINKNEVCTLRRIHKELHLCPDSLPTALDKLPRSLHFTGILIDYEELQLVGWKREVLITLSEGGIETLKVSMWLSHENPKGLRFNDIYEILGRVVHVKHVRLQSFDFTQKTELQFYGEIKPPEPSMHTILVPVVSGGAFVRFQFQGKPYPVNDTISLIPKRLQDKRATSLYPILPSDTEHMLRFQGVSRTYHTCLSNKITFNPCVNPFQNFINRLQSEELEPVKRRRLVRISDRWVRSYHQQLDWELRQKRLQETNSKNLS